MKVQEAVEKAVIALKDAFFDEEFHDLKLEEVELGDDGNAWYSDRNGAWAIQGAQSR